MTKLLEQAIATVRALPDEEQDAAADALFVHLEGNHRHLTLSAEQIEDVRRIQRDIREGRLHLASDEEMVALWKKCGL
jgi:hypothetical protein